MDAAAGRRIAMLTSFSWLTQKNVKIYRSQNGLSQTKNAGPYYANEALLVEALIGPNVFPIPPGAS